MASSQMKYNRITVMEARINHIGLYVQDLEEARCFFEKYFGATAGEMYHNPRKDFKSYLLTMGNGSRLELMMRPRMTTGKALGVCHISLSVGSKETVDEMTETMRNDGYEVVDGPRTTGDGYYESAIVGVDGNLIEITI